MAVGEKVKGMQIIPANGTYAVKPEVGQEWTLHNICSNNTVELMITDGTINLPFTDVNGSLGLGGGFRTHLTNSHWLVIRNLQTSAVNVAFNGVQTK